MRTALCLAALALVSSARAATIRIGGDFHLGDTMPNILVFNAGKGDDFVKLFLAQPVGDDRHEIPFDFAELAWASITNNNFEGFHSAYLFGAFIVEEPTPYVGAMTLELVGGPLVGPPEAPTGQQWTFIVDGGAPEVRTASFIPEPSAWALAAVALAFRRRHR